MPFVPDSWLGLSSRTSLPDRLGLGRSGAGINHTCGELRTDQVGDLAPERFLVTSFIAGDLAEQGAEVVASETFHGQIGRLEWIELRLQLRAGKDDAAFTAVSRHDPLIADAILVEKRDMFVGTGRCFGFQTVFDFLEFLI